MSLLPLTMQTHAHWEPCASIRKAAAQVFRISYSDIHVFCWLYVKPISNICRDKNQNKGSPIVQANIGLKFLEIRKFIRGIEGQASRHLISVQELLEGEVARTVSDIKLFRNV